VTTTGGAKCWGYNLEGQVGDGTQIERATPVDVVGLDSGVASVGASLYTTCALTRIGGVKCWGWNISGAVGDGTTLTRLTSVDVLGLTGVIEPLRPAALENPTADSFQSGIGVLSGWSCEGGDIGISIDGKAPLHAPYGSARADTATICNTTDPRTGFGLLVNFNTMGAGPHHVQLFVNGTARGASIPFTVTLPAGEFITGVSREVSVPDFPTLGKTTRLVWQQSQQNFAIAGVAVKASHAVDLGITPLGALENPQTGSFQSGIGLLSGWSCAGPTSISIDGGTPIYAPYGSARADTASVCGTSNINTGFGLLINFNTLGAGTHRAQLFVNGGPEGNPVTFTVTVPAGEFLSDVSKQVSVTDFPQAGSTVGLVWQRAQQNFAIQPSH